MSLSIKKVKTIQILSDGSLCVHNSSFLKNSAQINYHKNDFKYFQVYDSFMDKNKMYAHKQEMQITNTYRQFFFK